MLTVLKILVWVPAILLVLYALPVFVVGLLAGVAWVAFKSGWEHICDSYKVFGR